jgi:thiol:disulfide interchange protein
VGFTPWNNGFFPSHKTAWIRQTPDAPNAPQATRSTRYKIAGMASRTKQAPRKVTPQPPKRSPLLLIVVLALIAAAGTFFFLHKSEPAPETATAPVAAPQTEAPEQRVLPRNHIYDESTDPRVDVAAALKQAKAEHKRVLIDFGGDWCGDCQVLDLYLHQSPNEALLQANFVVVHVFIDRKMDDNRDIAVKYEVPLKKGVPALAVLDAQGKLLHAQTAGEFENMRNMESSSVTDFLNRWKA